YHESAAGVFETQEHETKISHQKINPSTAKHTLRPYQQECIDTCIKGFEDGILRQAVSLPVGSGKTVIFSNLIKRMSGKDFKLPKPPDILQDSTTSLLEIPERNKFLVLAHREELIYQAAKQIERACPHLSVSVEIGSKYATMAADIIVASVPTLGKKGHNDTAKPEGSFCERLQRFDPDRFKCIIIDEAHHASALTYRRILNYFGTITDSEVPKVYLWGCSATLRRHDGLGFTGIFDQIVYHHPFINMIKDGWLCPLKVTTIKTNTISTDKLKIMRNDFELNALSRTVNTPLRNKLVVDAYVRLAGADRKSTLVFGVDIDHVNNLCAAFEESGITALAVTGKTGRNSRVQSISEFANRNVPVMINCGILTEGTDIPAIDCIIMARPTKSPVLFQQMLGRGLRLFESKKDCLVIDFIDSFSKDNLVVTTPTLLGMNPDMLVEKLCIDKDFEIPDVKDEGENQTEGKEYSEEIDDLVDSFKKKVNLEEKEGIEVKDIHYSNPYAIFEIKDHISGTKEDGALEALKSYHITCGDSQLLRWSNFAWVSPYQDHYTILIGNTAAMNIRKETDEEGKDIYRAYKQTKISTTQNCKRNSFILSKPKCLDITSDMPQHAISACDTYIKNSHPYNTWKLLMRNAQWRYAQASPAQLKYLTKLGVKISGYGNSRESNGTSIPNNTWINKGMASDLILRLTSGSGKDWRANELKETLARKQRAEEKRLKEERAQWVN
ncbi:DEAD DEAH box helicase, partial [Mycoemilia scoparia]